MLHGTGRQGAAGQVQRVVHGLHIGLSLIHILVMSMYNILYGSVGVYFDYGTPEQVEVVTLREGDFFKMCIRDRKASMNFW